MCGLANMGVPPRCAKAYRGGCTETDIKGACDVEQVIKTLAVCEWFTHVPTASTG